MSRLSRRTAILLGLALLVCLALPAAALAQTITGGLFEDRNANGVWEPGEPPLADVPMGLLGTRTGGIPYDVTTASASDGSYLLSPGNGCYVVDLPDPDGWRLAPTRQDRMPDPTPGYTEPVGLPRFGKLDLGPAHLRAGALSYAAMGDSIAWNFNFCSYPESFWYSKRLRDRLACAAPGATITLTQAAVKGEHTDDLLVDDTDNANNVFRIMELQPDLISLSMIGNDLLDVDVSNPTQAQVNTAVAEILDARRNLQEALSVMVSEVPDADIVLNTLYDNLAYNCPSTATSAFHRTWVPIMDQMLRDLAWGQRRRIQVAEVAADFGQEGLAGQCTGFDGLICRDFLGFDRIHPDNDGYKVVREKLWEATGGVLLGSGDALGRTSTGGVNYGFLRKVKTLYPTTWVAANGAAAQSPEAAMSAADAGASASIILGEGSEEYRLAGFPDYYDEIAIVKVVAGVRYRTTGSTSDDLYRMEISPTGNFAPPADFSTTNWNVATPLVGGGGPNQPASKPDYPTARLLALPDVPSYREVSATLTLNPVEIPGAQDYLWPAPTHADLATTTFRLVTVPQGGTPGNDNYTVEIDAVWLDLYGWERPRPAPVDDLRVAELPGGDLEISFQEVPGAEGYSVYFGRTASLRGTGYDHGAGAPAGPHCGVTTSPAGGGRHQVTLSPAQQPGGTSYILVTARAGGVESPAGFSSAAVEIDRAQSICQ